MKKTHLLVIAVALCAGCAGPQKPAAGGPGNFLQRYGEHRRLSGKLAEALGMLEKGDSPAAARTLSEVCSGSSLPGVTDEALFRLALLTLKPAPERPISPQARQLLQRLKREFPASPWTAQAAPLIELINLAEELRRQNRGLKTANHSLNSANRSLTREIKELNKNLEQLKHLDLELEKKNR